MGAALFQLSDIMNKVCKHNASPDEYKSHSFVKYSTVKSRNNFFLL